jgi:tetratricopeptide (TPR) repeat protein
MMRITDEHLEQALREYNDKVSDLETGGTDEELLEALVNRSTILMLMGSYTSAMTDLEDAIELSEGMKDINVGTYVKMYENRGQLLCGEDNETMVEDYGKIVSRLGEINGEVRHYDKKGLIVMCIECSADLIDYEYYENSVPFTQKAIQLIGDDNDEWSTNRIVQLYNLIGEADVGMELSDNAADAYSVCIKAGEKLYGISRIDDPMELVTAYIHRGDLFETSDKEKMWKDHERAAEILEELNDINRLSDVTLLVNLHQAIASSMMESREIERAEKHLMKAINLGVPGMKEAINELKKE